MYEKATQNKKKIFYDTQHLIDADIKGCFDNISHGWLLNNVPMPKGFEHLLPKILKTEIQERETKSTFNLHESPSKNTLKTVVTPEENNRGVPQGGIISPLLMNWTLDGMEDFIKSTALEIGKKKGIISPERMEHLKKQDAIAGINQKDSTYRNRSRIEWYNTT